jgi:hypothetical protein
MQQICQWSQQLEAAMVSFMGEWFTTQWYVPAMDGHWV